ncbi:fatty acyl-AMP ligase [Nocardiopsis mangrovi]|uniref:Fatty acyl-AMP ligase n=1 Tax=Nocardiopsis mangrovi TaxID=1179818 RepID=A0ABV9DZN9_9ACTN
MTSVTGPTRERAATIIAALNSAASGPDADRTLMTALDGGAERLTAAELDLRARTVASRLRAHGGRGDRVLLPAAPGLAFHTGFLACLYAGMIAVPVPEMRAGAAAGRLESIHRDCAPRAAVLAGAGPDILPGVPVVPVTADDGAAPAEPDPAAFAPETTALLQYTSGSTGDPRGVVISHGNLVANQAAMADRLGVTRRTTVVSWLPLFHDMGLCTGLVLPLVSGADLVRMEPTAFVRDPLAWLRAISAQEDVFSAAPDFAYNLCVGRTSEAERASLDLSPWRLAGNGSEPVRAQTLDRFAEAFAPAGFRRDAFRPGYGMAETTLVVTIGASGASAPVLRVDRARLAEGEAAEAGDPGAAVALVGNGTATEGTTLRIVDPLTGVAVHDRVVGEIWVRSPSNGHGYWRRPEASAETFGARLAGTDGAGPGATPGLPGEGDGPYVRTGDLGFLSEGELFVTGRIKDILIIGGINYYPQDAEAVAAAAHPAFTDQPAAAWTPAEDDPAVVVVLGTAERDPEALRTAVRAAGIAVARVVPAPVTVLAVRKGAVPRTTSGKIQRRECAARARSGSLAVLESWSSR